MIVREYVVIAGNEGKQGGCGPSKGGRKPRELGLRFLEQRETRAKSRDEEGKGQETSGLRKKPLFSKDTYTCSATGDRRPGRRV